MAVIAVGDIYAGYPVHWWMYSTSSLHDTRCWNVPYWCVFVFHEYLFTKTRTKFN